MMVERETTSTNLIAKVSSAIALTGEEQAGLSEKLDARFGQPLELRFDVDPSLLGGVKVRVGDQVIDGSVKGKLEALAQSLGSRQ